MAKQIAKLLKATIQDSSDLKQIAKQLAGKGRGGDSMLVHITPREATMLKEAGGAGTINPDTGLMEFFSLMDFAGDPDISTGGYRTRQAPVDVDISSAVYPGSTRSPSMDSYFTPSMPAPDLPPVDVSSQYNLGALRQPSVGFQARLPLDRAGAMPPPSIQPDLRAEGLAGGALTTPSFRGASVDIPEVEKALGRQPSFVDRLKSTATSPRVLETLGLMGVSAIPGILQANRAREQGQRAREEMQAMAAPYRRRGQELLSSAQAGELSPQEQQQLQAMQARMAQGVAGRGGVGADQAANQIEAFRQQLLANKYDLGLKVSGIADDIATGAIKAGLEADQYVNELTTNYFSNAMQMAMMNMGQRPQTP